jgi:elongation factor P
MQTVLPSEFKRGMVIMLEGAPQVIEDSHTTGTAQTKHKLHVRLRNLRSSRLSDRVFAENERTAVAELEQRRVTFSYKQGDTYAFLDAQTFDEFDLTAEQVGERRWFLKEEAECRALLLDGKLLDIVLPPTITLAVADTGPAQKGGSDAAWKEARLETGFALMVPLFIGKGDRIRVDTSERKYAGKDAGDRK